MDSFESEKGHPQRDRSGVNRISKPPSDDPRQLGAAPCFAVRCVTEKLILFEKVRKQALFTQYFLLRLFLTILPNDVHIVQLITFTHRRPAVEVKALSKDSAGTVLCN